MIVYPIYVFYDQWQLCLFVMVTLNLKKKDFFNDFSSKTMEMVGL